MLQIYLSKKDIAAIANGETRIDKGDVIITIDAAGIHGDWINPDTGEKRGEVEIMNEIVRPWKNTFSQK